MYRFKGLFSLFVLALLAGPQSASSQALPAASPTPLPPASPSGAATYVGSEACKECHEDTVHAFGRTLHSKVKGWEKQPVMSCETCHGPASIHLKKVEDSHPDNLGLPILSKMKGNQLNQVCLKCHESQHGQAQWRFSRHNSAGVSCVACHTVHPENKQDAFPSQLKARDPELCYTCHKQQQAEVHWPSRHPILEGRLLCGDCHNVHGANLTAYKNAPNSRELCLSCHAQYRGPFRTGHAPASDSCMDCHKPHGSVEQNLLVASEPFLCLRCHSIVHNPHRAPGSLTQTQFQSQTLFFSRCTTCHQQVHGSNSGPSLTR